MEGLDRRIGQRRDATRAPNQAWSGWRCAGQSKLVVAELGSKRYGLRQRGPPSLRRRRFVAQREDALFLGPPGTEKSHLAQAIGRAVIQQGYRVLYREVHTLLEELADATIDGTRKAYLGDLAAVPLLLIDDLGLRKLPHTGPAH